MICKSRGAHLNQSLMMLPPSRNEVICHTFRGTTMGPLAVLLTVLLTHSAWGTNHILRQDQLMAGFNGDPTVQYLVITVGGNDQKAWGPQSGETSSRAMLTFFNSNGVQTGTFFFPNNPPQGGLS